MIHPHRVQGLVLISFEDIEDEPAKQAEIAFFEQYIEQVKSSGLAIAWESILGNMSPVIGTMVKCISFNNIAVR